MSLVTGCTVLGCSVFIALSVGDLDLSVGVTSLPTVPSARQVANLTEASVLTMVGLR